MTWDNHKILTISIVIAYLGKHILTPNIFYIFPAVFGSIFPDLVEGKPPQDKNSLEYQKWSKSHRQYSHWFVIYLVLWIFAYYTWIFINNKFGYIKAMNEFLIGFIFFLSGCLLHLIQDIICGKIPSLNPNRRIGIRLFKVGDAAEHVIVFIMSIFIISVFLYRVS